MREQWIRRFTKPAENRREGKFRTLDMKKPAKSRKGAAHDQVSRPASSGPHFSAYETWASDLEDETGWRLETSGRPGEDRAQWMERWAPGEGALLLAKWEQHRAKATPWDFECRMRDRDQRDRWLLSRGFAMGQKWLALTLDITAQKDAEAAARKKELAREHQRRLIKLTRTLENEYHRISQELHDGQGAVLTGIRYQLEALQKDLAQGFVTPRQGVRTIKRLNQYLVQAVQDLRFMVKGLQHTYSGTVDFVNAMRGMIKQARAATRMNCRFLASKELPDTSNCSIFHPLFRIAQESIYNSIRHSQGTHLTIQIRHVDGHLILSVSDNGSGFKGSSHDQGFGVRIMKHRAGSIGGRLEIAVRKGGGTVVTCRVPI